MSEPLTTHHRFVLGDARALSHVDDASVELVVTSPPYPMIAMWDDAFAGQDRAIAALLRRGHGAEAYERMHAVLDAAWREVHRVLVPGGFACVNIGDAVRSIGGRFRLFPSHARILQSCLALGFDALPELLWRKPTNAPNKFMGSGMLPAGAYVTLEHEFVLVLRKGSPRRFVSASERRRRRESAFFWEERNAWFSDLWADIPGTGQGRSAGRSRSAAQPLEIAHRLISMFSLRGDTVLDPFAGTGTTALAAALAARSSVSVELDAALLELARSRLDEAPALSAARLEERLARHAAFVAARGASHGPLRHHHPTLDVPCMSAQETALRLSRVHRVSDGIADGATTARSAHGGVAESLVCVESLDVTAATPRTARGSRGKAALRGVSAPPS